MTSRADRARARLRRLERAPATSSSAEVERERLRILAPTAGELVDAADAGELDALLARNPEAGPRGQ